MLENPFAKNRVKATASLADAMKNYHFTREMLLSAVKIERSAICVSNESRTLPARVDSIWRRFLRNFLGESDMQFIVIGCRVKLDM
jgi:hypothetical protein